MSPSSPIIYPTSSPAPARAKRPRQNEAPRAQAAPRVLGGFMVDDDSDDDQENLEPLSKKRMTEPQPNGSVPAAAPRVLGGFMVDDDSDDPDEALEPLPKKCMTEPQPNKSVAPSEDDSTGLHFSTTDSVLPDAQVDRPEYAPPDIEEPIDFSQIASLGSVFASATRTYKLKTSTGAVSTVGLRKSTGPISYESMVAARSRTKEGRAKRAYYGVEIHELTRLASLEISQQKESSQQPQRERRVDPIPLPGNVPGKKSKKGMLWSEKYRARKFTDLCGDDGTNRLVLRWIKRWDPIVFPGSARPKPKPAVQRDGEQLVEQEKPHKNILLLTGPPGLGKTTLAHVCAKQAGYEVVEINASDDRSKNVVNNRIRTSLGTENVKTVANAKADSGRPQKPARPVCVMVDEVDGVTTGSGPSGEGGFIKALIDLVLVDQKNAAAVENGESSSSRKKKKGDDFRQRRPLILICNDVYHPSLRPLRQSNLAEIIHVGKPTIDAVVGRLSLVFEKEGIPCEKDAARKLCEAAWGMSSGPDAKKGAESTVQGDLRGVMVVGEWVAGRFRSTVEAPGKLTKQWVEKNVVQDLTNGGARGTGRGGSKDVVSRVFQDGAGFPRQAMSTSRDAKLQHEQPKEQLGFSEFHKRNGMAKLQQMVETSGEVDRIMTDIISEYPTYEFNDDSFLTKPNEAYDWFHFLDSCSTRLYTGQEWELAPYLSQPVLACHDLFASTKRHHGSTYKDNWGQEEEEEEGLSQSRFFGPRASWNAYEAEKHNRAALQAMQAEFSPTLGRLFRSPEDLATDFIPYLTRLVSPAVNPVLVGGSKGMFTASVRKESERKMAVRAADVMADVGISLQKGKLEGDPMTSRGPQWVYRMEP